jgi:hypothetical protein
LRDLQAVNDEIGKMREEIMLRARVLGAATLEFDEVARTATRGYGSIRNAIELVRQKFASAMNPTPTLPPPSAAENNGGAALVPDPPA